MGEGVQNEEQPTILVSRNWQESGPFTRAQLHDKILAGDILLDSWYWCPGMPKWEPLTGLFPNIEEERRKPSQHVVTVEIGERKKTSRLTSNQVRKVIRHE
jgi:hypothetical protein